MFDQFELATGKLSPASNQISHRRQFARWASREEIEAGVAHGYSCKAVAWLDAEFPVLQGNAPLGRVKTALSGATEQRVFPRGS